MKKIENTKINRYPKKLTFFAIAYAVCFIVSCSVAFGVCYSYFSAKLEPKGNITSGNLKVEYVTTSSVVSTTLQVKNERTDSVLTNNDVIMPGDNLIIQGDVKNTGNVSAFVILKTEFILLGTDSTTEETVYSSKFYTLSGTEVVYDSENEVYTTPATTVNANTNATATFVDHEVNTDITNQLSDRIFKLKITICAIQSDLILDANYSSLAIQATNQLINSNLAV